MGSDHHLEHDKNCDKKRRRRSRSREHRKMARTHSKKHRSGNGNRHEQEPSRSHRPKKSKSRRRPSLYWDVPPQGFEHVSPRKYKAEHAANKISVETPFIDVYNISKQARRLYVGHIPLFDASEDDLMEFFNNQMHVCGLAQAAGNPIVACQVTMEKHFAFLEFRSIDETTLAMAFDGINFKGWKLKIRRPREYQPPPPAVVNAKAPNVPAVRPQTDHVGRASVAVQNAILQQQIPGIQFPGLTPTTEILCLLNMITPDELKDEEEYEDIVLDIKEECNKYGIVRSIEVPRPIEGIDVPGCGKVFVEFNSTTDCQMAQQGISGRTFNKRIVVTTFYDPGKYQRREF